MKKSSQPFSAWMLAISVLIAILQYIPYTGFFMAIFGGGFLTRIAFLGFIFALSADCILRRVPRWLAVVPVAFFGSYYVMYISQMVTIHQAEAKFQESNPGQVLEIDFDTQALVTPNAEAVVMTYAVPVAYSPNKNFIAEQHLSFRILSQSECKAIPRDSGLFLHTLPFKITDKNGRRKWVRDLCNPRFPEKPVGERIEIVTENAKTWKREPSIMEGSYTLKRGGLDIAIYRTGFIYRYRPFPFPYFMCFLNSSSPSWDCDWGFSKSLYKLDVTPDSVGPTTAMGPEAIMLGLKPYTPADIQNFKFFDSNEFTLNSVMGAAERVSIKTYRQLNAMLENNNMRVPSGFASALAADPTRLSENASVVVAAFVRFAEHAVEQGDRNSEEKAKAIATAIAGLREKEFLEHGPSIMKVVSEGKWWRKRPALYIRTADLGPTSFPIFRKDFLDRTARGWLAFAPVMALCRLPNVDEAVLLELERRFVEIDPDRERDLHQALFLALLRHGKRSIVEKYLESNNIRQMKWYRKILGLPATETEGLPNNCATKRWPVASSQPFSLRGTVK
ncbi:MAG: hypothetical protein WBN88_11710 [Anderseniella sp.]